MQRKNGTGAATLRTPNRTILDLERRLHAHRKACGCREGAVAMFVGLLVWILATWANHSSLARYLTHAVIVGFSCAIAGKIMGICWARYQYRRLLISLKHMRPEDCGAAPAKATALLSGLD